MFSRASLVPYSLILAAIIIVATATIYFVREPDPIMPAFRKVEYHTFNPSNGQFSWVTSRGTLKGGGYVLIPGSEETYIVVLPKAIMIHRGKTLHLNPEVAGMMHTLLVSILFNTVSFVDWFEYNSGRDKQIAREENGFQRHFQRQRTPGLPSQQFVPNPLNEQLGRLERIIDERI